MDAHLRDLRYFVAVAEELSFTRAAETLHVSQPALSKQIRALEAALKIRLLDRSRRQVQLTPAGIAVRETATRLLAEWDDGVAGARAVAQLDAQRLIVGTLTSLGRGLYPLVVDAYARVQPGWQIDLRSFRWTDSSAGLRDRETDAAFLWLPIDGDDVAFEVLFTEPVKVALAAGHRLATRTGIDIEELASESFVALPEIAGEPRDFWLGTDVTSPRARAPWSKRTQPRKPSRLFPLAEPLPFWPPGMLFCTRILASCPSRCTVTERHNSPSAGGETTGARRSGTSYRCAWPRAGNSLRALR